MRSNGQLITCDRCGNSTFRRKTGEAVMDGGFTRYDQLEKEPEGWGSVSRIGDLCPRCYSEWESLSESFLRKYPQEAANRG